TTPPFGFDQNIDWELNTSWPSGVEIDNNTVIQFGNIVTTLITTNVNRPVPIWHEHCDVNVDLHSSCNVFNYSNDAAEIKTTSRHTMQITFKLQTGGKATPGLKHLLRL